MMDVANFAQMLLPFILLGQGIWFLIDGITEEKKRAQSKENAEENKAEKVSVQLNYDQNNKESWI